MSLGLLAAKWKKFRLLCIPPEAPAIQVIEMRRAFYAGAESLKRVMLDGVSDEEEMTNEDLTLMFSIEEELQQFATDVQNGVA